MEVAMPVPVLALEDLPSRGALRHQWIDYLLVLAGFACLTQGWWLPGAGLAGLGFVMPLLQRSGRKRRAADLDHLVPPEMAAAYREVLAATALPGVQNPTEVAEAARDALLEVGAVLGGRPPRGGPQRRLVAAHVVGLTATADELRHWSEAWVAARAEVESMALVMNIEPQVEEVETKGGPLVGVLTLLLAPFFIAWDSLCALARGAVVLVDGLALRFRTTARLAWRTVHGLAGLGARARQAWTIMRARIRISTAEARGQFLAMRVQVHLRLRRALRQARRARCT